MAIAALLQADGQRIDGWLEVGVLCVHQHTGIALHITIPQVQVPPPALIRTQICSDAEGLPCSTQ